MEIIEPFTKKGLETFLKNYSEFMPEKAIEKAKNRIIEAVKNGRIELGRVESEYDMLMELATFYAEIIILEMLNNTFVKNRVVISEAKSRYEQRIIPMEEEEVMSLAEKMDLSVKRVGDGFRIGVSDYLEYAPESLDYNLVYKNLDNGWVEVNKHEIKRIIQEAIKKKIEKIKINLNGIDKSIYEESVDEIKKIIPKFSKSIKSINFEKIRNPPCIEKIIERLKKHENLAHYERWVLAIYLVKLKVPIEEIEELYKNLPDYNERITGYQLKHIKEKNYNMPSCDKMRGYGLCVEQCGIKNPMEWVYERKGKKMDKKQD